MQSLNLHNTALGNQNGVFSHPCLDPDLGKLAGTQQLIRVGKGCLHQNGTGAGIHLPVDEVRSALMFKYRTIDQNQFELRFQVIVFFGKCLSNRTGNSQILGFSDEKAHQDSIHL